MDGISLSLSFDVNPEQKADVDEWFRRIGSRVSDFSEYFKDRAIPILQEEFEKTFAQQGRPPWAPLSPRYRDWKARKGYPTVIGIKTGAMKQALVEGGDIEMVEAFQLTYGTSLTYAGFFHEGTRKQPARPLFEFYPEGLERLEKALFDYIDEVGI